MSYFGTILVITSNLDFDFGSEEVSTTQTVLNTSITNTNFKEFSYIPVETTATSLDDFGLNGVSFNIENIIDNVSFDIRATAVNNASGVYRIKYIIKTY